GLLLGHAIALTECRWKVVLLQQWRLWRVLAAQQVRVVCLLVRVLVRVVGRTLHGAPRTERRGSLGGHSHSTATGGAGGGGGRGGRGRGRGGSDGRRRCHQTSKGGG